MRERVMGNFYVFDGQIYPASELTHHGVEGMSWGHRNGPPYPLGSNLSTGKSLKENARAPKATLGDGGVRKSKKKKQKAVDPAKQPPEDRQNNIRKAIATGNKTEIQKYAPYMTTEQLADAQRRVELRSKIGTDPTPADKARKMTAQAISDADMAYKAVKVVQKWMSLIPKDDGKIKDAKKQGKAKVEERLNDKEGSASMLTLFAVCAGLGIGSHVLDKAIDAHNMRRAIRKEEKRKEKIAKKQELKALKEAENSHQSSYDVDPSVEKVAKAPIKSTPVESIHKMSDSELNRRAIDLSDRRSMYYQSEHYKNTPKKTIKTDYGTFDTEKARKSYYEQAKIVAEQMVRNGSYVDYDKALDYVLKSDDLVQSAETDPSITGSAFIDSIFVEHHGVKGMTWGHRNGPPYPLDSSLSTGKSLKENARASKVNKGPQETSAIKKKEGLAAELLVITALYSPEIAMAVAMAISSKKAKKKIDLQKDNEGKWRNDPKQKVDIKDKRPEYTQDSLESAKLAALHINDDVNKPSQEINNNCVFTSMSYQLNRRGYNTAAGFKSDPTKTSEAYSKVFENYPDYNEQVEAVRNHKDTARCSQQYNSTKQLFDSLNNSNSKAGYLSIQWAMSGVGHAVSYEKIGNEYYIVDAQIQAKEKGQFRNQKDFDKWVKSYGYTAGMSFRWVDTSNLKVNEKGVVDSLKRNPTGTTVKPEKKMSPSKYAKMLVEQGVYVNYDSALRYAKEEMKHSIDYIFDSMYGG